MADLPETRAVIPGFVEFEFDLPEALLARLIEAFDGMEGAPLLAVNLSDMPEAQGVYQLLFRGLVVYIGKTDADAGLRRRLERHSATIQHRKNLDPAEVRFKAVRVFVFTAMDLETQLIRHYGSSARTAWNFSGFGSNDPGRNRDMTDLKAEGFDALYPIDIDRVIDLDLTGTVSVAMVLKALKEHVPYTFRFEGGGKGKKAHPDLDNTKIKVPSRPFTTRTLINTVLRFLPAGWQATALAGRVILYREERDYPSGTVVGRSS